MLTRLQIIAGMCLLLLPGTAGTLLSAPLPELWARWEANDPASMVMVDHSLWKEFLTRYVETNHPSGINRVRYSAVRAEDRDRLAVYVSTLQEVPVSSLNRQEQCAYWINLYNALTVKVVLAHYPVSSIRHINISPGLFSYGPWDAGLIRVEGQPVSLNDIEHRILRPIWKDNRHHYAVNCASLGCPNLQPEPFVAGNLDSSLDKAAREYVNHPRGARLNGGRLVLSSIYDWFQMDFGSSEKGVVLHLLKYAGGSLAEGLKGYKGRIKYEYDWRLNE
jgi:hypothetical protein